MQIGDLLTYLPDNMLARGDKVLMGASVEGRMPLLDHRIIERVTNVPASSRAGLRTPKAILQSAVSDLVPGELLRRPKRGFPVPVERFLIDDDSLIQLVASDRALDRNFLDQNAVRRLVTGSAKEIVDRDLKLFTLASLELWIRMNLDTVRTAPPEALEEVVPSAVRA